MADACRATDGEWAGFTTGSGSFKDNERYGEWAIGECLKHVDHESDSNY